MKKILALATILICLSAAEKTDRTNFNGTWTINTAKSSFGGQPPGQTPVTVAISQEENSLNLTRTVGDGPPTIETYNFDGSVIDTVINSIYHKSSFIKWSDDQQQFKILSKYHVTPVAQTPYDYTRTEGYSISADGNLVIDRITVLPDATQTSKAVYEKKQ